MGRAHAPRVGSDAPRRDAPGDATHARELIAAGRAEAETLGMARELVRFERRTARRVP